MDLKAIADEAVKHGTAEAAFSVMVAQQDAVSKGKHKVTDIMIADTLGLQACNEFLSSVEMAVPSRVMNWLSSTGINVNHPDTIKTIQAINPPHAAAVLGMGSEVVDRWAGLELGNVEYALRRRNEGTI